VQLRGRVAQLLNPLLEFGLRKTQMSRKKRLLINIDYDFAEGDVFEEAVLEKRRIAKLMQSLKETTGSIVDIQIKLDDRRGEKTSDLSKMKFRRN
jgi:hypothetical protein